MVPILLNNVWHSAVVKYGCVRSRNLWIKFKFSVVKVCVVVGMLSRTLDNIGNGYRLCILGDLNGWIGDRTRAGITGAFGVLGENDIVKRVVKFCE